MKFTTNFPLVSGASFATAALAVLKSYGYTDISWPVVAFPVPAAIGYTLSLVAATALVTAVERLIASMDKLRAKIEAHRPDAEPDETKQSVIPPLY